MDDEQRMRDLLRSLSQNTKIPEPILDVANLLKIKQTPEYLKEATVTTKALGDDFFVYRHHQKLLSRGQMLKILQCHEATKWITYEHLVALEQGNFTELHTRMLIKLIKRTMMLDDIKTRKAGSF